MDIFVTTWIKLPRIKHNEIMKILRENLGEKMLSKVIVKGNLKQHYRVRVGANEGMEEIRLKTGKTRFLASDCFATTKPIPCWYCRERQGTKENGVPFRLGIDFQSNEKQIDRHGFFCGDRCMYAYILEKTVFGSSDYEMYVEARNNTEMIHTLKYPDRGCLIAANDWRLLKSNGGTLDYDMWNDEKIHFERLPGYEVNAISMSYIQT